MPLPLFLYLSLRCFLFPLYPHPFSFLSPWSRRGAPAATKIPENFLDFRFLGVAREEKSPRGRRAGRRSNERRRDSVFILYFSSERDR